MPIQTPLFFRLRARSHSVGRANDFMWQVKHLFVILALVLFCQPSFVRQVEVWNVAVAKIRLELIDQIRLIQIGTF